LHTANLCERCTRRLRPDLYQRRLKDWLGESLPHTGTWPFLIDTARRGGTARALLNRTVFACGVRRLPGDKSTDACFWSADDTMDRVLRTW
jgi:hypothetical protein